MKSTVSLVALDGRLLYHPLDWLLSSFIQLKAQRSFFFKTKKMVGYLQESWFKDIFNILLRTFFLEEQSQQVYIVLSQTRSPGQTNIGGKKDHQLANPNLKSLLSLSLLTQTTPSFVIRRIFSLTRGWSKRVTWLIISLLKLGNTLATFPDFQTARVPKNTGRIKNAIACIWRGNVFGY